MKALSYRVKLRLKMLTGPQPLARATKDGCLAGVIEHAPSAYVLTCMNFNIRDEINTKNEGRKRNQCNTQAKTVVRVSDITVLYLKA